MDTAIVQVGFFVVFFFLLLFGIKKRISK